jgi:PIN domain nuclease of toxin-antitoxin system
MKSYLLDTHVFIWWITEDERLSKKAFRLIEDDANQIYFSSVSAFEIAVKARLGRLREVGDPVLSVPYQVSQNGFEELKITVEHSLKVFHLPEIHSDPFDRILVAQSQTTGFPIITNDKDIKRYPVQCIW